MGLYANELAFLRPLVKTGDTVLSIGHPDILATPEELRDILGVTLKIDNTAVREARNYRPNEFVVGNARPVFEAMGATLTTVDIRRHLYNIDIEADFNYPVQLGHFDLVIDGGATEHCFSVGQAIKNIAEAVKVGGHVYHMVPMCHWNHGFWNFSPTAFADFYDKENGFEVILMQAEYRGKFMPVQRMKKFEIENMGRKLNIMCIAKKLEEKPITFPMQRKYR